MSEEPHVRRSTRAPRPSTRYDHTHWETGSLASRTTTSSAASIRRRRQIQEEIQDTLQKLELHSKVMELRHELRDLEAENTEDPGHNDDAGSRSHPNKAIPAWIEQQPKQPDQYQAIPRDPDTKQSAAPTATEVRSNSNNNSNPGSTQTTTTYIRTTEPPQLANTMAVHCQPGAQQEIAPANGQVLESTPTYTLHVRWTQLRRSWQRTWVMTTLSPSYLAFWLTHNPFTLSSKQLFRSPTCTLNLQ